MKKGLFIAIVGVILVLALVIGGVFTAANTSTDATITDANGNVIKQDEISAVASQGFSIVDSILAPKKAENANWFAQVAQDKMDRAYATIDAKRDINDTNPAYRKCAEEGAQQAEWRKQNEERIASNAAQIEAEKAAWRQANGLD